MEDKGWEPSIRREGNSLPLNTARRGVLLELGVVDLGVADFLRDAELCEKEER
jgi:hypothetical protein